MIDFETLGQPRPEDLCPVEGCGHAVTSLGFTSRHRWNLDCRAGSWWEGCNTTRVDGGCECPGCKPRRTAHTRRLDLRLTKTCSCARNYPEAARMHTEHSTERKADKDDRRRQH